MTTEQKVTWEEINSLEDLKVGDELEYKCPGANRMFNYWGEVTEIMPKNNGELAVVRVSGDWNLVPSSLTANDGKNKLTRKVVEFEWPAYVGACVGSTRDGVANHYVRIDVAGHKEWVHAESGEYYATWEMELVTDCSERRVLGRGY